MIIVRVFPPSLNVKEDKNNDCYQCAGGSAVTGFTACMFTFSVVQSRRSAARAARRRRRRIYDSLLSLAAQFIKAGIYKLLMPVNN